MPKPFKPPKEVWLTYDGEGEWALCCDTTEKRALAKRWRELGYQIFRYTLAEPAKKKRKGRTTRRPYYVLKDNWGHYRVNGGASHVHHSDALSLPSLKAARALLNSLPSHPRYRIIRVAPKKRKGAK